MASHENGANQDSISYHHFCRHGSKCWEADQFSGVLLSCNDILAKNIECFTSSRKSTSPSFFNISYSRIPLSDVHTRARHDSIRSEANICAEDLDNCEFAAAEEKQEKYSIDESGVFQHQMTVTVQPVDVVVVVKPIVNIIDSMLSLDINPFFKSVSGAPVVSKQNEPARMPRNGIFCPFPVINLDCKGVRVLLPDRDTTHLDNIAILCLQSFALSSDPENRINSTVFNKEWYRCLRRSQRDRNRRTKSWHVQYQIDLEGMSVCTGKWQELCRNAGGAAGAGLDSLTEKQNPALEWNFQRP